MLQLLAVIIVVCLALLFLEAAAIGAVLLLGYLAGSWLVRRVRRV